MLATEITKTRILTFGQEWFLSDMKFQIFWLFVLSNVWLHYDLSIWCVLVTCLCKNCGSAGSLGVTMTYFMVRSCRITLLSILISRNHFGSMTFLVEKFFYNNGVKHYCEVIYGPLNSVIFWWELQASITTHVPK